MKTTPERRFGRSTLIMTGVAVGWCVLNWGCGRAVEVGKWRLADGILTPPRSESQYELKGARGRKAAGCGVEAAGIRLIWKGKTARVWADGAALLPGKPMTVSGAGVPTLSGEAVVRNWFREDLRKGLLAGVERGCLTAGEARGVLRGVSERLALPPEKGYRLLYGEYVTEGYVDLDENFRLKAVEPVRVDGVVRGYRSSYYRLIARADGGVKVEGVGSETVRAGGAVEKGPAAEGALLQLPGTARYLRLFLRSWSTRSDRRIAIVAAGSEVELERATVDFESAPEDFCGRAGLACVDVAKDSVIGPELRVVVDGEERWVGLGGTLAEVLRGMKVAVNEDTARRLRLERPWGGRLTAVEFAGTEVFRYMPVGGERISLR